MPNNAADMDFEALLGKYDYTFKKGEIVKGTVYGYDTTGVSVDIGAKNMAVVPLYEIGAQKGISPEEVLKKGEEYEFLIIQDADDDGQFTLSYKRVHMAYIWLELEKAKQNDETIAAPVIQVVKGGVIVDISGLQGFVPQGQIYTGNPPVKVGDKLELKLLTVDKKQNNLILSNKKVFESSIEENRKNVLSQVEVGQIVKGEVVRLTDFGVFVNVGGLDCLLPLSQLSWKWVEHPSDLLSVGQVIDAEIIDIDTKKNRISLSLKNLEPDPWAGATQELQEGMETEGLITRIKNFGAFVEVKKGVEALLPQNCIEAGQKKTGKEFKVGDSIKVKIIKFNSKDRRISLDLAE